MKFIFIKQLINMTMNSQFSPDLWYAVHTKDHEEIQRLIDNGHDINGFMGPTVITLPILHMAAKNGNCGNLQLAIQYGADVNQLFESKTPLHYAGECMCNNRDEVVRILKQAGAWFDATDSNNRTPLQSVIATNPWAVSVFCKHDPLLSANDKYKLVMNTAYLHGYECIKPEYECIKAIIDCGHFDVGLFQSHPLFLPIHDLTHRYTNKTISDVIKHCVDQAVQYYHNVKRIFKEVIYSAFVSNKASALLTVFQSTDLVTCISAYL